MGSLSLDVRRRLVAAYEDGLSETYESTAELFAVGEATVSRLLRRFRETGDVLDKPRGGNNPRRVDLDWLRKHAEQHPDARLFDRVQAWERHSKTRVHVSTMGHAMHAIGWTHKKRLRSLVSKSVPTSKPRARSLSRSSPR